MDTKADLELVRRLYSALGVGERAVGYRELLAYARAPQLPALNAPIASRGPRTMADPAGLKCVATVEARMTSSRLPGKVLLPAGADRCSRSWWSGSGARRAWTAW